MLKVGSKVRVSCGSGIDSDKSGVVIRKNKVKTNGRGVPKLEGYYSRVNWAVESAIKYDDGSIGIMFDDRLISI